MRHFHKGLTSKLSSNRENILVIESEEDVDNIINGVIHAYDINGKSVYSANAPSKPQAYSTY